MVRSDDAGRRRQVRASELAASGTAASQAAASTAIPIASISRIAHAPWSADRPDEPCGHDSDRDRRRDKRPPRESRRQQRRDDRGGGPAATTRPDPPRAHVRPAASKPRTVPRSGPAPRPPGFAIASAAPAQLGRRGIRTANGAAAPLSPRPSQDRQQRDPERERQPRPGRALKMRVVRIADRQDDHPELGQRTAGPTSTPSTRPIPHAGDHPVAARRDEARRDRLAGLGAQVPGLVDEVVRRPDRRLEGGHRHAETGGTSASPPAIRAMPAMTAPSSSDGNGWMSRISPTRRRAGRSRPEPPGRGGAQT